MPTQCFKSLQGLALRVTRLDSCGNPIEGSCSTVVSESFVTLGLAAEIQEPDEFTVQLANGRLCLSETGVPTLRRYNATVEICNADPDLLDIFSGTNSVVDFAGNAVGFQVDTNLSDGARFALEIWTRVPLEACTTGTQQYLYWLLPNLGNGRLGDFTIENGPLNFTLTAEAIASPVWGAGPYDVVAQDAGGTAGPLLDPLPDDVPLHVQLTTIAPPTEVCGCQALVLPS